MTKKQIDEQIKELIRIRFADVPRAMELAKMLIEQATSMGYSEGLAIPYHYLGDMLRVSGKLDEAEHHNEKSLLFARQVGDFRTEARGIMGNGLVMSARGRKEEALALLEQAAKIASECSDTIGEGLAYNNLANIHALRGSVALALTAAERAYDLLKDTSIVCIALYTIAECVFAAGDLLSAAQRYEEVIEIARHANNEYFAQLALAKLGMIYDNLGEWKLAERWQRLALEAAVERGDTFHVNAYQLGLAEILMHIGGEFEVGKWIAEAIHFFTNTGHLFELCRSHYIQAKLYLTRLDPQNALDELKQAEAIVEPPIIPLLHESYAEAYEQLEDWKLASHHHRQWKFTMANIRSAEAQSKAQTLQTLLFIEKEKRETELQRLQNQQLERELTNSTLQLIAQTELLSELRDDLLQFIRKFPMPDAAAKELRERLKTLPCKAVDWEKFDTQFKSAHPEFTKKLIEKHPTLSPTELRICSLVRMNLKSEDIARLLCLSERTVEDHRANARKKMKMNRSEDLIAYLVKL